MFLTIYLFLMVTFLQLGSQEDEEQQEDDTPVTTQSSSSSAPVSKKLKPTPKKEPKKATKKKTAKPVVEKGASWRCNDFKFIHKRKGLEDDPTPSFYWFFVHQLRDERAEQRRITKVVFDADLFKTYIDTEYDDPSPLVAFTANLAIFFLAYEGMETFLNRILELKTDGNEFTCEMDGKKIYACVKKGVVTFCYARNK